MQAHQPVLIRSALLAFLSLLATLAGCKTLHPGGHRQVVITYYDDYRRAIPPVQVSEVVVDLRPENKVLVYFGPQTLGWFVDVPTLDMNKVHVLEINGFSTMNMPVSAELRESVPGGAVVWSSSLTYSGSYLSSRMYTVEVVYGRPGDTSELVIDYHGAHIALAVGI